MITLRHAYWATHSGWSPSDIISTSPSWVTIVSQELWIFAEDNEEQKLTHVQFVSNRHNILEKHPNILGSTSNPVVVLHHHADYWMEHHHIVCQFLSLSCDVVYEFVWVWGIQHAEYNMSTSTGNQYIKTIIIPLIEIMYIIHVEYNFF